ncbi:MAG: aspartate 1-decarboxylase [Zetaproteobacteria bacterium]|nr:MAG: aspartate 1-decarboxylase [Zetaproteobacteria bacterium]
MILTMLKSKIHRAVVTHAEQDYEGSCAIDEALMEAADIRAFEQLHIYNVRNGERFTTYAIAAPRNSGVIGVNGAAAHKAAPGDLLIICTYATMDASEADSFHPRLVYVDDQNVIRRISHGRLAAV